jgi:hypothetical protein
MTYMKDQTEVEDQINSKINAFTSGRTKFVSKELNLKINFLLSSKKPAH